jgi:hypothetical protein
MSKFIALVALIAALSASAAQGASKPALTLNVSGFKVLYGHTLILSGRLTNGAPGQSVAIFSRRFGHAKMAKLAIVKTGSSGRWSFQVKPSINTSYQARVGATVSRSLTVGVKPAVTVSQLGDGTIWTHIAAGQSFMGQQVELQKQVDGAWSTVSKAVLNARSSVTFMAPVTARTETVRIAFSVNQAGAGFLGANSDPLLYHAVFVSLAPAASKVLYGNRLELAGRISSHQGGQIIQILAREYGTSAPLKSTIVLTRDGGFWNTSVEPSVGTTYQARWGANGSRKLVVGVEPAVTVTQLIGGGIRTHVSAGRSFAGKSVELQQFQLGLGWKTLTQLPLKRNNTAIFAAPIKTGSATLRIAMSVNEAGIGYLGASSHPLAYHTKFVSLAASVTKVLFGKALVLSGQISARTSGESITILGWKYGHSAPTKIGVVKTVKNGRWSLRVRPGIQTGYVARWGASDSTKILIGVEPLATLTQLADGRVSTHIAAAGSFAGRKVQLQQLQLGLGWRTVTQMPLNHNSSAIFPTLATVGANSTLRIAMSVNEAGAGFLGTTSHAFIYHSV